MARTRKGKSRFQFRILLLPVDAPPPRRPWIGTSQWKQKAMYNIKMYLSIQISRAENRAKWKWYKFYYVRGYGAPGRLEFVCPYSYMIAKTVDQHEAASIRRYWAECGKKSREVLDWLNTIKTSEYTKELNHYLLRLIVAPPTKMEILRYMQQNPFHPAKPWQEL